ncbi:hypothetical protein QTG54_014350 [Skeletonema marinoi]|uniref:Uncharacterized protein n=1 Tax=Skeletonema marinoi TaxID=267567 RepID=A0AAD8XWV0_9STRA|nr:hypothetical protein QTG54_014350 [Skeletonema marinoi]
MDAAPPPQPPADPARIAQVLFPNPIEVDLVDKVSTAFDKCVHIAGDRLKPFGYKIGRMELRSINCSIGHDYDRRDFGRSGFLYCSRCSTISAAALHACDDEFKCSVVATYRFNKVDNVKKAAMKVMKVFPHASQCNEDHQSRRNHKFSTVNGGNGFTMLDFDYKSIIGDDVFSSVITKLSDLTIKQFSPDDGGKYGERIVNTPDHFEGSKRAACPDSRFYCYLKPTGEDRELMKNAIEHFGLDEMSFIEAHHNLQVRLLLYIANTFNIPDEIFLMETHDNLRKMQAKKTDLNVGYSLSNTDSACHLSLTGESIVHGGFQTPGFERDHPKPIHQIPHQDIGEASVNGKNYSVSQNPWLKKLFKPSSIFIPICEQGRKIVFFPPLGTLLGQQCDPTVVTVKKGQLLIFEGDVVHGGFTYARPNDDNEPLPLYPSLHCVLQSSLHKRDLESFDISEQHVLHMNDFHCYIKDLDPAVVQRELDRALSERDRLKKRIGMLRKGLIVSSNGANSEEAKPKKRGKKRRVSSSK